MARSLPVENLLPQNLESFINSCNNLLKQPNVELLVAVDQNQLRTMTSETVYPIDLSHPPPSWAVPSERLRAYKPVQPEPGIDPATVSMGDKHLAYAATQGIGH